ncbi:geranylgeranyl reductase family protein [Pseudoprimorskyibacter insulae]|uniref:Menaquinone reductase n=1 Tax=Pseudoprimorskyibacter insulae TaxID=1695997 RepID=A0A2R8APR5_9RHOB|nr:geranylgeranyl reductase family protein [Pseudoprimorskyibacter insulae]SPF77970.1 Menaquinone reductase [Pseudoprimorskyibacter insulae]
MPAFDLIVLGAGPAGSTAAFVAASKGLSVALVDKAKFPRDKLCGGGFTGRSTKYFRDAFGQDAPDVPMRRFHRVSFHAFGQKLGTYDDIPPLDLLMRTDLDAALVQLAKDAGAACYLGTAPQVQSLDAPCVRVGAQTLTAPILIAADGANSQTAKALFGDAFDRDQIGFALELEYPGNHPDAELRIDFGAADWGYGWHFPKQGSITVGVGGVMRRNPDMKAHMARYMDDLGLKTGAKVKGQFLPFGGFRAMPGKGRVLLAGDAAGLVDPITGEGIAFAIRSGHMAANAVIEAAHEPDRALRLYKHALRPIHRAIRQARMIRPILFLPQFQATFINRFRASRTLRREYLYLLAGEREYGEITLALLGRLPSYFLPRSRQKAAS